MKKILFCLVLAMTCEKYVITTMIQHAIYRCENDEVICYTVDEGIRPGGLFCKFKETK